MIRFALTVVIFCVVWLVAGAALAAEAEPNAATQTAGMVIEILAAVLVIVLSALARKAVKALEAKTGVDVPDKMEAKIDAWVDQGIHLAAEKSYKKVKEGTEKLTGPEKLEEAAGFVLGMVKMRGWDEWTKDKIVAKVDAAIGTHRAAGGTPNVEG